MTSKFVLRAILLFAISVSPAHAVPITISFSAFGFTPIFGSQSAPTDPVNGTIVYDAASATSNINSLTSIDLTIGGHTYSVGELAFISPFGAGQIIGGSMVGPDVIAHGTDDFWLIWGSSGSQLFPSFAYSVTSPFEERTTWESSGFSRFSITEGSAPEPATVALLVAALMAFGVARSHFSAGAQHRLHRLPAIH